MLTIRQNMRSLERCDKGATAIEYALIVGLMALGIAAGIGTFADLVINLYDMLNTDVGAVSDGTNPAVPEQEG